MKKTHTLIAAAMMAALTTQAVDYQWNNTEGGNWSDSSNWTPTGVPGSEDSVVSPSGVYGQANIDTDITLSAFRFYSGNTSWKLVNTGSSHSITINGELYKAAGRSLTFTSNSQGERLSMYIDNLTARDGEMSLGEKRGWVANGLETLVVNDTTKVYGALNINAENTTLGLIDFQGGSLAIASVRTGGNIQRDVFVTGLNGTSGSLFTTGNEINSGGSLNGTLVITGDGDYNYSGDMMDYGDGTSTTDIMLSVRKEGSGTQRLNGSNNYTGTTVVNDGALIVNGTHANAGSYQINGGVFGGNGTITTDNEDIILANGATLAPGDDGAIGTFTLNVGTGTVNLSGALQAQQVMAYQVGAIGASDAISVTGQVNIGNGLLDLDSFDFEFLGNVEAGTHELIASTETISGTLGSNTSGTVGDYNVELYMSEDGRSVMMDVSAVIPEVSTTSFLIGAGALLALFFKRNRKSAL